MQITIHEAVCNVGYAQPVFRGIHKVDLIAEIAQTCRKNWTDPPLNGWAHLNLFDRGAPPIPTDDYDVITTYFWAHPEDPEDRWIEWSSYAVEVGQMFGSAGEVRLGSQGQLRVQRTAGRTTPTLITGPGAALEGTLIGDMTEESDALESFILALAAEGFPIQAPEFNAALTTAIEAIAQNKD